MSATLVIVPCGKAKIWGHDPFAGPTPARDAYTGGPFKVNRAFAKGRADRWLILSAKYGFISPDFVIPGPYDVTFTRPATKPISMGELRQQVADQRLFEFETVIGLGGTEYREAMRGAFADWATRLVFPFAGLGLGPGMQAVKRATLEGRLH